MPRYGYAHYRNVAEGGSAVFITTTCLDFVHVFARPRLADLMAASLLADCRFYGVGLSAFVVMPHHVHLLVFLPKDLAVTSFMNRLKANAARRILPNLDDETNAKFGQQRGLNGRTFWQRSFRSFPTAEGDSFWQKVRYIHLNPVRAGLVMRAEDYRWSSARLWEEGRWSEDDGLKIDDSLIGSYVDLADLWPWRSR